MSGVIDFIKEKQQFVIMIAVWLVVGMYAGPVIYGVVALSIFLMRQKNLYVELFLGFFLMLIFSDNFSYFSFAGKVKPIYMIGLAGIMFFNTRIFAPFNKLYLPFIPFFIYILILTFFSEIWLTSLQKSLSFILLYFVVPVYISAIYREKGEKIFKYLVYVGALVLLAGIVLIFINPILTFRVGRYNGLFGNPNGLGLYCTLFFLMFSTIRTYFKGLFNQREELLIYVLIALSVVLCGSRNSIISIGLFLLFVELHKVSPLLNFIFLLAVVVFYEITLSNLDTILYALGLENYFRAESLNDASGRYVAWAFAWEQIQKNYAFGKGFAHDEYVFSLPANVLKLNLLGHQGNVHNSYLTFWLNTGMFGLIFYFSALLLQFFRGMKNSKLALPILYSVLFSINFESWLMASLNPYSIQLLVILTIIVSPEFNENTKEENTLSIH